MLARTLEAAGLSTILVTNMPFWAEKVGAPRTLAVEHPYGHMLGQPTDSAQQIRVIRQALDVFRIANSPGTIVHSPEIWLVSQDEAIQNWQPPEPSPVIAHMSKHFRELLRKNRKGGS